MSSLDNFHKDLIERRRNLISKRVVVVGLIGPERWVAVAHNAKIKAKTSRIDTAIEMIEDYKVRNER
ncbi:hypothetical protein [Vibrio phage vB_VpaP_SJSY21]|nr:hypothetical protein [Vibrio phage vB_VpaP_SJSY21]